MFCNQCGKEIESGGSFCTNCGAPVGGFQKIPPPQRQKRLNGSSASRMTGKQWFGIILSVFGVIALIYGVIGIITLIEHEGSRYPEAVPIIVGITIGGLIATVVGFLLFRGRSQKAMDHTRQEENTKHKIEKLEQEIEELKKRQK